MGFGLTYEGYSIATSGLRFADANLGFTVSSLGLAFIAVGLTIIAFAYAEISGARRFQILNDKLDWLFTKVKSEEKSDKETGKTDEVVAPKLSLWKESPSFVIASILFLVVIVVVDGYIVFSFNNANLVPKQISPSVAQPMLLALIQADGVFLGFVGAVFAVIFGRSQKVELQQEKILRASKGPSP